MIISKNQSSWRFNSATFYSQQPVYTKLLVLEHEFILVCLYLWNLCNVYFQGISLKRKLVLTSAGYPKISPTFSHLRLTFFLGVSWTPHQEHNMQLRCTWSETYGNFSRKIHMELDLWKLFRKDFFFSSPPRFQFKTEKFPRCLPLLMGPFLISPLLRMQPLEGGGFIGRRVHIPTHPPHVA